VSALADVTELDLDEDDLEELKEIAVENVRTWIGNLSEDAWKGIEYDEREGRYVACFDFDEFGEDGDSDAALSGMISSAVTMFRLTPEDVEGGSSEQA